MVEPLNLRGCLSVPRQQHARVRTRVEQTSRSREVFGHNPLDVGVRISGCRTDLRRSRTFLPSPSRRHCDFRPLLFAASHSPTLLSLHPHVNPFFHRSAPPRVSTASRLQETVTKDFISHSIPAHKLNEPFFLSHLTKRILRHWHRPQLTYVPPNRMWLAETQHTELFGAYWLASLNRCTQ